MCKFAAALAVGALLACGCATQQKSAAVKLEVLPEFELDYRGEIGDAVDITKDMPEYTPTEGEPEWACNIEVRVLRGSRAQAEALFGDSVHRVGAWSVADAEISLAGLGGMTVVTAPRLSVFERQQGTISITNQVAYISAFQIRSSDATRVADPVVDVLNSGLVLSLRASGGSETHMRLELDLTMSEVVRPMETQEVQVFGAPMTIQLPVMYTQRLKAQGEVSESRTLVLTGMVEEKGEVSVLLVKGTRTKIEREPETPEHK